MHHATNAALLVAILPHLAAQSVTWTQLATQTGATVPPARRIPNGFTHDGARNVFLMFGGRSEITAGQLGDTWIFDGLVWSERLVPGPVPRSVHGIAFDPRRQAVVLFGGSSGVAAMDDTWVWNGAAWSRLLPAVRPAARTDPVLTYYPPTGRVILFAGRDGNTYMDDTWEWDGASWTPAAQAPGQRYSRRFVTSAAFHAPRSRIVMFGGHNGSTFLNDTWEFDGVAWTQVTTANAPSPRHTPAMCYSPTLQGVLVFGGENNCAMLNDVWRFDGDWVQLQPTGSPVGPSPRGGAGMAYDPSRDLVVVAQGRLRSCVHHTDSPETWALAPATPSAFSILGTGCAGSTGIPSLAPQGSSLPSIGQTFRLSLANLPNVATGAVGVLGFSTTHNNSVLGSYPLPFSLAPFGMPGCTQHVSDEFTFFLLALTGQVTWPISIPPNAMLAGLTFHVQAVVPDAGVNALGAVVTNAGTGVIGS